MWVLDASWGSYHEFTIMVPGNRDVAEVHGKDAMIGPGELIVFIFSVSVLLLVVVVVVVFRSCFCFETGSCAKAQAGFKLTILPSDPKC